VIFYDLQQGSPEWHDVRRGVPTASCFDKIMTPKTQKISAQAAGYICQLVGEKMSIHYAKRAESYTSKPMQWGQQTEEEARNYLSMTLGLDVTNGGFCTTDDGRFGASPDGLIGEDGALELKCPLEKTHVEYLLGPQEVPTEYVCQVHGQLIVTGRKWVKFMSYAPGLAPFVVTVEPNDFTKKLQTALDAFWLTYNLALERVKEL
jgi:putative phage-type endonuclease